MTIPDLTSFEINKNLLKDAGDLTRNLINLNYITSESIFQSFCREGKHTRGTHYLWIMPANLALGVLNIIWVPLAITANLIALAIYKIAIKLTETIENKLTLQTNTLFKTSEEGIYSNVIPQAQLKICEYLKSIFVDLADDHYMFAKEQATGILLTMTLRSINPHQPYINLFCRP